MPNIPGATTRQQSPYASKLATLEPEGATALALAALALLDVINTGRLVATDTGTRMLIEATYPLQDALYGASDALPAALAGVLSAVGGPRVPIQADPENPAPRPMRVEEAIGHFLACNKAFSSLEVLLIEIDGSDNLFTQGGLIDTGLGIAKRYADLAQGWRDELKARGVQS